MPHKFSSVLVPDWALGFEIIEGGIRRNLQAVLRGLEKAGGSGLRKNKSAISRRVFKHFIHLRFYCIIIYF